ncbi:hypothetical protein IRM71_17150 [Erwinia amylovora]|uniref:hypothetical protein n=1 Tax=Erwinia amylovora TaxID=552 RepID=UPI001443EAA4|nr:hypothetical protein [Erwinia amylovora]UDJ86938.1 hypothetical protein IRM68_00665 [Erwinia amylovora]UDJ98395.1 hypothetical protein IRM69_14275 [Erwinia amylovora]UDK89545.1 hypothetical protein IRM70_17165 [Erwinia amylovora]UDK92937.1 hypothetical protein IRM71_17150 [Erwinia amylovora]UOD73769.1 hypothetical protein IRM67_12265 [Erwinia amylovora]
MAVNVALMQAVNSKILTVSFMLLNLPYLLLWPLFGDRQGRHLQEAGKLRLYHCLMALS